MTESCIANVVVELNGMLFTPPVECGLLAGTYRNHLLLQGKIREKIILVDDIGRAETIYLINSVRGMWQVRLWGNEGSGMMDLVSPGNQGM